MDFHLQEGSLLIIKKLYCSLLKERSIHLITMMLECLIYQPLELMQPKTGILKNGKRWFPNENGRLCQMCGNSFS